MKKSLLVLILFSLFLGSCATYTCPTYASHPVEEDTDTDQTEERI